MLVWVLRFSLFSPNYTIISSETQKMLCHFMQYSVYSYFMPFYAIFCYSLFYAIQCMCVCCLALAHHSTIFIVYILCTVLYS